MTTVTLTDAERLLWAKTGPDGTWHPLWCHLVDVGTVAAERFRRAPDALKERVVRWLHVVDEAEAAAFLGMIAGLHDLGKCSPPFQSKVAERKTALRRVGVHGWPHLRGTPHPHMTASLAPGALRRSYPEQRCRKGLRLLVEAVAIHHGGLDAASGLEDAEALLDAYDEFWVRAAGDLTGLLCGLFGLTRLPPVVEERTFPSHLALWLAGLVSVSDWIGSDVNAFPFEEPDVAIDEYRVKSVARARAVLDRLRLDEPVSFHEATFSERFGFAPRALQTAVRRLAESIEAGPVLVCVECPMGEGKSEAALDACAEISIGLGSSGFFVGLPTQATSNAMHERVREWLASSADGRPYLRLAHGSASLRVDQRRDRVDTAMLYGPGDDALQSALAAAEWFSSGKRALLDRCGVGTVDQALMGVLPVRHGFVRLGALAGRVVILDEIHAYDEYTGHLVQRLVSWLGAQGSSVILLSATLPSPVRRRIIEEWCQATGQRWTAEVDDYPRISMVTPAWSRSVHAPATPGRRRVIRLEHVDHDVAPLVRRVVSALDGGGCVGWVCNSVARAQEVYRSLRDHLGPDASLDLLHARYTMADRERIERQAMSRLGRGGQRPSRYVLVGTQVIEQSLDLDFDLMITDLAPVDLVLQRAGRLHRHDGRTRPPAMNEPALVVIGSREAEDLQPRLVGAVYSPTVMLLSRTILDVDHLCLPDDIEPLVEAVYAQVDSGDGIPEEIRVAIEATAGPDEALAMAREGLAEARAFRVPGEGHPWARLQAGRLDQDDADGDPTATRLGEPSLALVVLHEVGGRVCLDAEGRRPIDLAQPPSWKLVRDLVRSSCNVTRRGLRGAASALLDEAPAYWKDQPLLRRAGLLVLRDGTARWGGVDFSYSGNLGLGIGKSAVPGGGA